MDDEQGGAALVPSAWSAIRKRGVRKLFAQSGEYHGDVSSTFSDPVTKRARGETRRCWPNTRAMGTGGALTSDREGIWKDAGATRERLGSNRWWRTGRGKSAPRICMARCT